MASDASQHAPTINIVIIGDSGTGKSTLINQFANYFLGGSLGLVPKTYLQMAVAAILQPLEYQPNIKVVIPTKLYPNAEPEYAKMSSESDINDQTKAQTKECVAYEFQKEIDGVVRKFKIIDSPGFNDTEGLSKDKENIGKILSELEQQQTLSAIVIVVNGSENRVTPRMAFTLNELRNMLPTKVFENIYVFLTKCTLATQKFDIQTFEMFKPKLENVYPIDNYVLSVDLTAKSWAELKLLQDSWDKSMNTLAIFLRNLIGARPVEGRLFQDMRERKNKLKIQLAEITQDIRQLHQLEDQLAEAVKRHSAIGMDVERFSNFVSRETKVVVEWIECDYHNTICMVHVDCLCHERCGLSFAPDGKQTPEHFSGCACMMTTPNGRRACRQPKCGGGGVCGPENHVHAKKIPGQVTKTIETLLEDIKRKYDASVAQGQQVGNQVLDFKDHVNNLRKLMEIREQELHAKMHELKAACINFNFTKELSTVVAALKHNLAGLTNPDVRRKAAELVKRTEDLINQLSRRG